MVSFIWDLNCLGDMFWDIELTSGYEGLSKSAVIHKMAVSMVKIRMNPLINIYILVFISPLMVFLKVIK